MAVSGRKPLVFRWVTGILVGNNTRARVCKTRSAVGGEAHPVGTCCGIEGGGFRCFSAGNDSLLRLQAAACGGSRVPQHVREARKALLEYLHCTRGLDFPDAEHMSIHSPSFLSKLLSRAKDGEEAGRSIERFLRYHTIDEFEPFFESMGLKPSEFEQLLPKDSPFLRDKDLLLANYHVLCNYGIARRKIGKICKEAAEVFSYEEGILKLKLQAYEDLGLSKTSVINIVSSRPSLLTGKAMGELTLLLEMLNDMKIENDWIGAKNPYKSSCNWNRMISLLNQFSELGFDGNQIGMLIRNHPDFLLDNSGKVVFSLLVLFVKLGGKRQEFLDLLLLFPSVQVGKFLENLFKAFELLIKVGLKPQDIKIIMLSHTRNLGSCSVKRYSTIYQEVNGRRTWLCKTIKQNPLQLMNWTKGRKAQISHTERIRFMLSIGYVENSEEMRKALVRFRGKGDELQKRYDYLVNCGLKQDDVSKLIKTVPHILNQKIYVLKNKVSYLVDSLGYPIETLVEFPYFLQYTIDRVKHRFLVYNWLRDEGTANPNLSISTILALSDKIFLKSYVCRHPRGVEIWQKFKDSIHSN